MFTRPAHLQAVSITPAVFATGARFPQRLRIPSHSATVLFGPLQPRGSVINRWTIAGNVDGLRVNPGGAVRALSNNDDNLALTVINPVTHGTTACTYGNAYTNVANRGFDDVEFLNGIAYLRETNRSAAPIRLSMSSPAV